MIGSLLLGVVLGAVATLAVQMALLVLIRRHGKRHREQDEARIKWISDNFHRLPKNRVVVRSAELQVKVAVTRT